MRVNNSLELMTFSVLVMGLDSIMLLVRLMQVVPGGYAQRCGAWPHISLTGWLRNGSRPDKKQRFYQSACFFTQAT
jgi:hypothetical protein